MTILSCLIASLMDNSLLSKIVNSTAEWFSLLEWSLYIEIGKGKMPERMSSPFSRKSFCCSPHSKGMQEKGRARGKKAGR